MQIPQLHRVDTLDSISGAAPNRVAWERFAGRHRSSIPLNFASALKALAPAGRVLELGCGYGRAMSYLIESGWPSVIGIDYSPTMLSRARASGHSRLILAQADRLPLESSTFAAVVSIATFSSLSARAERRLAMREIARVLSSGGVLLLRDFALTLSGWRLARYLTCYLRFGVFGDFLGAEGIRFHHLRRAELLHLTAGAGLNVAVYSPVIFPTMYGRSSNGFTLIAQKPRLEPLSQSTCRTRIG